MGRLYRLELSGSKSFTYSSREDTLFLQAKPITLLADDQRCLHLLNLASKRAKGPKKERPLFTAFMMKLAQTFAGYDAAVMALESVYSRKEERMEVLQCFVDVLQKKIKPMFPVAFEEPEEDEEQETERASSPESTATTIVAPKNGNERSQSRERQIQSSPIPIPPASAAKTPEPRGRKRVIRSVSPNGRKDDDIDIASLRSRIKKLKNEQEELESAFKELQKQKQEKLLARAGELQKVNKELKAKIEELELSSDDEL